MTQQANPFDAFGQVHNALQGAWDQRTRNQAGRAYASGDMDGATNALASGGMLQEAGVMRTQQRADETRERSGRITEALRSPDPSSARALAQTPEELAGIQTFVQNASAQELAAARQRAGNFVAALTAIGSIQDPAQRLAAAQQQAPAFGLDPATITIEQVSPEFLEAQRVQALGLEEYLKYQDREADNRRPLATPFGIYMPPGTTREQMGGGGSQPEYVDQLPPGVRPRPNQPPRASAARGGERSQTPRVSFQSSGEATNRVRQMVPGVNITNADRTPDDTARLRRQGYNPSDTSFHLRGQALDLTPPRGMTMAQLEAKMRQAGFRVLNEGHHIHVSW